MGDFPFAEWFAYNRSRFQACHRNFVQASLPSDIEKGGNVRRLLRKWCFSPLCKLMQLHAAVAFACFWGRNATTELEIFLNNRLLWWDWFLGDENFTHIRDIARPLQQLIYD